MDCELCGKRASGKARVEGTVISVCDSCSRFGEKIFESKTVEIREKPRIRSPEEVYFVQNFPSLIKQKRESLGMKEVS
jgi:ribosome-binding protein aMBF1 (putative translation factor)